MSDCRPNRYLPVILLAILPACSSGDSGPANTGCPVPCVSPNVCDLNTRQCVPPAQVTCPQACPTGTVCDAATKQCVPTGTQTGCNPACTGAMICDAATNKCVPNPNAGDCSPACGNNAFCSVQKVCTCNGGFADCNGNLGQGADGCECNGPCEGTECQGEVQVGCRPEVLNDCGDATRYCNVDQCVACPDNSYNCDGFQDCEEQFDCAKDGCELFGSKTCVSQNQFCDQPTKTCNPCPAGTFNCDRAAGTCECTTSCDGSNCKDECTSTVGCTDTGQYCDFGVCTPCDGGRFNCDGAGNCECDTLGCNGDQCVGERACDYYDADGCGDNTKWCYQNVCQPCSSGFNCNGTMGCECDSAGCTGDQCTGKCSGGEC